MGDCALAQEACLMFDSRKSAPKDEEEMEDFPDYEDEEHSELDSKLDDYDDEDEDEEEEDEMDLPAMPPPEPLPVPPPAPTPADTTVVPKKPVKKASAPRSE